MTASAARSTGLQFLVSPSSSSSSGILLPRLPWEGRLTEVGRGELELP